MKRKTRLIENPNFQDEKVIFDTGKGGGEDEAEYARSMRGEVEKFWFQLIDQLQRNYDPLALKELQNWYVGDKVKNLSMIQDAIDWLDDGMDENTAPDIFSENMRRFNTKNLKKKK